MGKNLTYKILSEHLTKGGLKRGAECELRADCTLVHDMSGLLPFMGFSSMGIDSVKVPESYIFCDHNLVSMDCTTRDNQIFLKSCAEKYGLTFSRPGNGVCHSVFYHRLGRPGMLLFGADSHTATAGALGMIGIGAGGMDVAVIMSGQPFQMKIPAVVNVRLEGTLRPGVSAKDAALTILKKVTAHGGIGRIFEYTGPGVSSLSVPQRATFANMGAEMGATSSLFPSDENVRQFLKAQHREADFIPLAADEDAVYEEELVLNLDEVVPMVAAPGCPDRGISLAEAGKVRFDQIFIGSCTNGSYTDIARAALVLKGRKISPDTELIVSVSSRQIYGMLLRDGYIKMMSDAGARIIECGCGPCMGIGQAPGSGTVILRTTNRNYKGRSGTGDAQMYLSGTEIAAASAVTGVLTAPAELMDVSVLSAIKEPEEYAIDDDMLLVNHGGSDSTEVRYGKNIRPIPVISHPGAPIKAEVLLKLGDGISTDDIVPPEPTVLTLRTNIPALSEYIFQNIDPGFAKRAKEAGEGILVAGEGYAQGSSREHAAIGCMCLGIRAVIAKEIHRIHRSNLINYGVLPLTFIDADDYAAISQGDVLAIDNLREQLAGGSLITVCNVTTGRTFRIKSDLNEKEREIYLAGGLVLYCGLQKDAAPENA